RFAMAFGVLIVPTALMGATLPLIIKSSLLKVEGLGARVGLLYGINTAGAIAGTLAAGLVLIPRYGIRAAFITAATLNLLVAIVSILAGRQSQGAGATEFAASPLVSPPPPHAVRPDGDGRARALVLVVFAFSGFASLALEVVWFRVVTLFLRPTVYGYALMLTAVLSGIAVGSFLIAPLMRRRWDWMLVLASLEVLIGASTLLSFASLALIPAVMRWWGPLVGAVTSPYLAYQLIVSFLVIFPTMVLFGAAFPIGLRLFVGEDGEAASAQAGRRVGVFYSLNLTGAIAGSLAAGFFLLPRLGTTGTVIALALISGASGWALAWGSASPSAHKAIATGIATAFFLVAYAIVPDPSVAYLAQRYPDEKIIWQAEAVQAMVSVHQHSGDHLSLNVNGNHQASTRQPMPFIHQRIGHLPMIVHPDAKDALVIGLGGGATAGAVSQHASVAVDVVELSREVTRAATRFFRPINFGVLQNPRVTLHVDDGRNFLLFSTKKYDVITADVILPIHAGSGNLYSTEYFELVRNALKPGGMALQWVAGTEAEYKLIMRTFVRVFPETTLWADGGLMLGSVQPLTLRQADHDRKTRDPERRALLASLGLDTFDQLLKQFVAGPDELRAFVGDGPVLTDDRPLVEYFLALPRDKAPDLSGLHGDVQRFVRH
ncbi:MAG: fused MFS/spermidine synthase, partial [Vicinamibacterales bacterium]